MSSRFPSALLEPITDVASHVLPAPRRSFDAVDRTAAQDWQTRAREHLAVTLGFLDDVPVPFDVEEIFAEERSGILHRKIHISTSASSRMPVHLLFPVEYPQNRGLVLAHAGHGYGVNDIVGLWEDGSFRHEPDGYQKDFALELCRRGFIVAAPEIAGFGERQNAYGHLDRELGQPEPTTCHHLAAFAIMLGKSAPGLRVRDSMRLVDFLQSEGLVVPGKLGAMGISGGGMLTMYHAAVDERVSASVISGYFCSFRSSILSVFHCPCNFVPGLYADFEMVDIGTLILPRAVLIESATRDPIFPIEAARTAVSELKRRAGVCGKEGAVEFDVFEGRHRIGGNRAYDFLCEQLNP